MWKMRQNALNVVKWLLGYSDFDLELRQPAVHTISAQCCQNMTMEASYKWDKDDVIYEQTLSTIQPTATPAPRTKLNDPALFDERKVSCGKSRNLSKSLLAETIGGDWFWLIARATAEIGRVIRAAFNSCLPWSSSPRRETSSLTK